MRSTLSKSHKKLADYIIDNYEQAVFLTASQPGQKVGVSESTVVRFAYRFRMLDKVMPDYSYDANDEINLIDENVMSE